MITDEHRRNHLDRLVEAWDGIFDPEIVGLRHSGLKSPRNPSPACEESLHYALALLEMAERSRQGRAEAIINRLVDPSTPPGTGALTLSLIWHRHRRRLPSALTEKIALNLEKSATSIRYSDTNRKSAVPPEAINEIFVLLSAARILDDATLRTHAINRLNTPADNRPLPARASKDVAARDLAVALAGFRAIDTYIAGADAASLIEPALLNFQNEILPPLQLRAGQIRGTDLLALLVDNALRGIQSGSADSAQRTFAALYACVMKIESTPVRLADEAALPAR
ncbi:hypothetical protein [Rariglobus hedericola]|uniref:Uncharacterized protein n=1 Tax=Rariglobus hedericola TaxID=2597822 RepID=A0A556QSI3_9BACT|nr:hypothetical protein [Rariglobus hedericola]TSJ79592.1 hypothetical protein FPL22_09990 [Rariglobus hedericola]